MVKAIIYNSQTGHTKQYAEMLSKKLEIPYYELKEAKSRINKNDNIIYLSWICAGKIMKVNKVSRYNVISYGVVGAFPEDENYINNLVTTNGLEKEKVFYLRGGINFKKLKGVNKLIVKIVGKVLEKNNKDNEELLKIFNEGASFVEEKNLEKMIDYIKQEE